MYPAVTPPAKRGLIEKVALVTLAGLCVLSVLGAALVTSYLDRISESTASLDRTEALPDYIGRPVAAPAENGNSSVNFLVLVTDSGSLHSLVVANLSASRRNLTLITVPAKLLIANDTRTTLASMYAMDPWITTRAMEGITGARMDHQITLNLDQLAPALDALGGVRLDTGRFDGAQAVSSVEAITDPSASALAVGDLTRAALVSASNLGSVLDPSRFGRVITALAPCLSVDTGLTAEFAESTLLESSVHPQETRLWPLAVSVGQGGVVAEPASLDELRNALSTPELPSTAGYRSAAFLPQEPPK